ncbi:MAG: hypothetical protein IKT43_01670, partial [Clostridia bacterium]|nr:hypothetical protein [Clostridia bacterium]
MNIGRAELSLSVGHAAPAELGAHAAALPESADSIPNAHGSVQTTSASAPAGVDVVCSMSLCSIKVILIYIPVRSAGGGLSEKVRKYVLASGTKTFYSRPKTD